MRLSCCIWALTGPEEQNLAQMAELGFGWIDIQPPMLATPALRAQAEGLGLRVASLGASFGLPPGAALDSADERERAAALAHVDAALAHAASLGAGAAYVVPGMDASRDALARFADQADRGAAPSHNA